ncbi:hypothetical protein AAFC00_005689 [Neodothiora populina]|uniref:Uncharacterized protein n=1 Tax=Neodothiora populina TaxID=2781224 RepID=A0ABR3P5J3_9PEZI
MAEHGGLTFRSGEYRKCLPNLDVPRFQMMAKQDAHEYANDFKTKHNPPWLYALYEHWRNLLTEPFKGVTSDGTVQDGLFEIQDEGVDVGSIVEAANAVIAQLDDSQRSSFQYHIDSPEWRTWSNPEFLLSNKGLHLDELSPDLRNAVMKVLEATLSPEGYDKAVSAMRINGFLGKLVGGSKVCNEFSYNFVLFGTPSTTRPWGWSFYGHHLCLNIFLYRSQIMISPWFTGAEPNEIDSGPYKGTRILTHEEVLGLKLMQSLSSELQQKAQLYKQMHDPAMPEGRWNRDDQRHLCGAYRDNRVVPYEGIKMADMTPEQRVLVNKIVDEYFLYLPAQSRKKKLEQAMSFPDETYFCWIGGYGDDDAFYYRIQNPVVIVEFDHHSGVFLNNEEPAKFHVHTLLRTPNAGDYGHALKKLVAPLSQTFAWNPEDESKGAGNHASRVK